MSDDPAAEAKSEERRARLEGGYRKNIAPVVDQIEREELVSRWEELGRRLDALQKRLDSRAARSK